MPRAAHRFFTEDISAPSVTLAGEEALHAVRVLRLHAGAEVELFDGQGGLATGRIVETGRRQVVVEIERRSSTPRPRPIVHLGFAAPKGRRLDWLLEKAAELGAASLQAVIFQRSVAGGGEFSDAKRRRWFEHCLAAAKQCGLDWLPEMRPPVPLADFLVHRGGELCILGQAGPDAARLIDVLARRKDKQAIRLLVGPEGGLTDPELAAVSGEGFLPVRLGRTTLRIETAAVALLAAIIAACGD
jgi:16S rRNA (uracil1498-N3)-methyltransferase